MTGRKTTKLDDADNGPAMLMETMSNIVGMSDAIGGGLTSLRVGIDPLDNGIKFSVEHSTWSPPYRGEIS